MTGKFIVFEGLDGSGESTQVKLLAEYFARQGKTAVIGKEPTSTSDAGREIIEVLTHKKTLEARALQELFVQDRKEHLKNQILPVVHSGGILLEDRYILSTLAFGSIECPLAWLKEMNQGLPWPDLTFILKVRAEVSLERIAKRGKPVEFFEREEKLRKVAETYDQLAGEFPKCFVVNGEQAPEKVHLDILEIIKKELDV